MTDEEIGRRWAAAYGLKTKDINYFGVPAVLRPAFESRPIGNDDSAYEALGRAVRELADTLRAVEVATRVKEGPV